MQAGFARYGEETVLYRVAEQAAARAVDGREGPRLPDPAGDAARRGRRCSRLYAAATPQPVQRLEALRLADWERQGANWRVPRSSLAPILRFADVEAFVQETAGGGRTARSSTASPRSASRRRTSRTT